MEAFVRKSIVWGLVASGLLLLFYGLVLSLANSFDHAIDQWEQWWVWISLLVVGFGVQVGLYSYVRNEIRERKNSAGGKLAVTGGVSAGSMVACCAHHVVDILPIIGLSATALFLAEYQQFSMVVGAAGHLVGLVYMLEMIRKHELYQEGRRLKKMLQFDVTQFRRWVVMGSVAAVVFVFLGTYRTSRGQEEVVVVQKPLVTDKKIIEKPKDIAKVSLPSRSNTGGGLTIDVTPVSLEVDKPGQFNVKFTTHQGDLDFNLVEQAYLVDDKGNKYIATQWQGGTGGHHLSGQLIFSSIESEVTEVQLVINDIYGVKERVFEWDLG